MIHICDVVQSHSPVSGGVKRYLTNKIRVFAGRSDVRHTAVVPAGADRIRTQGRSRIHEVRSPYLIGSKGYRLLVNGPRIERIIAAERPGVVEVDSAYPSAWMALGAGRRWGCRVTAFYHSDYPRALGDLVDRNLPRFAARPLVGAIDRYLAALYNRMDLALVSTRTFQETLHGLGVRRVARVPLGANTEVFFRRNGREAVFRRLDIPPEARLLLYVGRLAAMKNIDVLLGMMDHLPREARPCRLLVVGDGEYLHEVRSRSDARKDILRLEYQSDPERLAEIYSAADLFVHAGRKETFGLVSVEAQACGTRVVAVRNSGMGETLEGEDPLILAEAPTSEALADAVARALRLGETEADRERRSARMVENFSWESTFGRMVDLYESLGSPSGPPAASRGDTPPR